jgi:hypothetical protein
MYWLPSRYVQIDAPWLRFFRFQIKLINFKKLRKFQIKTFFQKVQLFYKHTVNLVPSETSVDDARLQCVAACVPLPGRDALLLLMVLRRHDVSSRTRRRICASCMHGHEVTREPHDRSLVPSTDSYDFSYHLRFGKFSAVLTTTGHTVGSFAVCMLKYKVKTTETDKRHVVSFSNVRFSKVPMDFMFHDHDTAERHWYRCTGQVPGIF